MLEKAFLTESRDVLSKKRLKESVCMSPKTRVATIGGIRKDLCKFLLARLVSRKQFLIRSASLGSLENKAMQILGSNAKGCPDWFCFA